MKMIDRKAENDMDRINKTIISLWPISDWLAPKSIHQIGLQ